MSALLLSIPEIFNDARDSSMSINRPASLGEGSPSACDEELKLFFKSIQAWDLALSKFGSRSARDIRQQIGST